LKNLNNGKRKRGEFRFQVIRELALFQEWDAVLVDHLTYIMASGAKSTNY
jgi:hypothetical protein